MGSLTKTLKATVMMAVRPREMARLRLMEALWRPRSTGPALLEVAGVLAMSLLLEKSKELYGYCRSYVRCSKGIDAEQGSRVR